jgi:hypothetical protein
MGGVDTAGSSCAPPPGGLVRRSVVGHKPVMSVCVCVCVCVCVGVCVVLALNSGPCAC